jgi:activator of HSP90 ATPase
VTFKAEPHAVYELLMDSKKHARFSESKAAISREVGGKISAYDEYIDGWNVELVPDKKIVQKWRESDWPAGTYSTASFELKKVPGGSRLTFVQTEVPEDQFEDIDEGGVEHYWERIKKMLVVKSKTRSTRPQQPHLYQPETG